MEKAYLKIVLLLPLLSLTMTASPEEMRKLKEVMEKQAREQGIDPDNLKPGESIMIPPEMTDEEEGSRHMPKDHRCDGCIAVAFQFSKAFTAAEKKNRKRAKLSIADVLDVTDDVCDKQLRDYGLKSIGGVKKLSGPGLAPDKTPGIMEGGGKWEARLKTLCRELIERYEEEEIYNMFRDRGSQKFAVTLCPEYCSSDEITAMKQERDEL